MGPLGIEVLMAPSTIDSEKSGGRDDDGGGVSLDGTRTMRSGARATPGGE